jgi:hypothetical protein
MNAKKFSDWMKIDLHIHTDYSRKTKEKDYKGEFSISTLKEKFKDNSVDIFSLTDHNIINVPAYAEYYSTRTETDPLLLLGMELDILVDNLAAGTTNYHSLLIFNISDLENVTRVNDLLEAAYSKKEISNPFKRCLTISEIVASFPDEDFFFIPHAGNTQSIVKAHQANEEYAQRMVLLMPSAFEKVPEKNRQRYNEGFNRVLSSGFESKNDLAYIDFSDNHNINEYPCIAKGDDGRQHEFCYIKGGKSFETIRLAFIDPSSRIKTSIEFEKICSSSINYIEQLKIEDRQQLSQSDITFSPHLNVFIGGRSSGKSLLMSILGKKFGAIDESEISQYSDVVDIAAVKIKTKLDEDFKDSSSTNPYYVYIKQGVIVSYFEERKLSELAKKAGKISDYQAAVEKVRGINAELTAIVSGLNIAYEAMHSEMRYEFVIYNQTISNYLSEEYVVSFDYDGLYRKHCSSGERYTSAISWSSDLIEQSDRIKDDPIFENNDADIETIKEFIALLDRKKSLILRKLRGEKMREAFLNNARIVVMQLNSEQSAGSRKKVEARTALNEIIKKVDSHFKLLSRLRTSSLQLEKFDYGLSQRFEISENIEFVVESVKTTEIKECVVDAITGGNIASSIYLNMLSLLKQRTLIKSFKTNTPRDLSRKLATVLQPITEAIDKPQDYLDYKNGDTSKNKSPGYNSEKYLQVILNSIDSEIIFIDQPEDNLGNRFITEELVDIIRHIKFKKQIFLVTHNPSIVVYGDAENIIISENNGSKIKYTQVVLEDRKAQKHICQILDGGEYVFDNRSRKYNIKRILREGRT